MFTKDDVNRGAGDVQHEDMEKEVRRLRTELKKSKEEVENLTTEIQQLKRQYRPVKLTIQTNVSTEDVTDQHNKSGDNFDAQTQHNLTGENRTAQNAIRETNNDEQTHESAATGGLNIWLIAFHLIELN